MLAVCWHGQVAEVLVQYETRGRVLDSHFIWHIALVIGQ